jgi:hypothetical protein
MMLTEEHSTEQWWNDTGVTELPSNVRIVLTGEQRSTKRWWNHTRGTQKYREMVEYY